nr:hypothetical protein [Actinomycetota bacterium]
TRPPAPISQLELLKNGTRPGEIAKSPLTILELLDRAVEHEWLLRLQYTNQRGQSQQYNVAIFGLYGKQVMVGILPALQSRTLTINRISWARVLTEAEEDAL